MNKDNLKKYEIKNKKKIYNILNIDNLIKEIIIDKNKINIKELNFEIEKFNNDEKSKIIIDYFKDYEFYIYKNLYILKNQKEIIFLRNSKEREFFLKSHFDFYIKNRKENELIFDFENRLKEILIYKNYIIFDYIKFDFNIIEK